MGAPARRQDPVGALTPTDPARLRAGAARAADLLVENAITVGGRSTWLGATVDSAKDGVAVVQRSGDAPLYEGSAGIAMASSAVAVALERDDLAAAAVGAARHAVSASERLDGIGL